MPWTDQTGEARWPLGLGQLKNNEQLRPRENAPYARQGHQEHHPPTPALHVDEPLWPGLDSPVIFGPTAHRTSVELWSSSTSNDEHHPCVADSDFGYDRYLFKVCVCVCVWGGGGGLVP